MIELWKPLIHDEIADGFMLSTYGRIKTKDTEPIEATYHSTNGYNFALFLLKNDDIPGIPPIPKQQLFSIDDLLAITFIPIPDKLSDKPVRVNHIDGNTRNNVVTNLEWVEDIEEWRYINDGLVIPDMYMVSNFGRVKNVKTGLLYKVSTSGKMINGDSYKCVRLGRIGASWTSYAYLVHHLVASEFVKRECRDAKFINHIDGRRSNNYWKNLEWCSHLRNMQHAVYTNLRKTKLDRDTVKHIWELLNSPETGGHVSDVLKILISEGYDNISRHDVQDIKCMRKYRYIILEEINMFDEDMW